jgi:hypothetical protein
MNANLWLRSKFAPLIVLPALALFSWPVTTIQASAQQIASFDAPNSGTQAFFGTESMGINIVGAITGDVTDDNGTTHGFLRSADGKFTEFIVPGASLTQGSLCIEGGIGTCPQSINDFGLIVGDYGDDNAIFHGFLRYLNGKIDTFDVQGAGTGSHLGTFPTMVNDFGLVTGYDDDSNNAAHGFLRTLDGKLVTFDISGAGTGNFQGTVPESINNLGVIAGYYVDSNDFSHGFIRAPDGKITSFDPPGSLSGSFGVLNAYINDLGVIAGCFFDANFVSRGFQRNPDGKYAEYEIQGGGTNPGSGTFVTALNIEGTATGYIYDNNFESHIFVHHASGRAKTFDIPAEVSGPDYGGSAGFAINARGMVTGRWRETNDTRHSFILSPQ